MNILKKIFEVRNSENKVHKIITLLGVKIKLRRKYLHNNPFALIIDTTLLCNNNCSFCRRSNYPEYLKEVNQKYKTKTMPFKIYKKIIDDACQYDNIKDLSLCGPMGEPLLNENIEKFYEYANSKKHFDIIKINTNGLALHKRNMRKLLNSMTEFSISVDSIDPETYEKIHGHKNLNQVIENIKQLVKCKAENGGKANIYVRFTENKFNRGQFPEFLEFFKNIGVDYINYTQEHGFAGANKDLINATNAQNCGQPRYVLNFNFLGDLTICCVNWKINPTFGNIKTSSISKLWNSPDRIKWVEEARMHEDPCNSCSGLGFEVQHSQTINIKELIENQAGNTPQTLVAVERVIPLNNYLYRKKAA